MGAVQLGPTGWDALTQTVRGLRAADAALQRDRYTPDPALMWGAATPTLSSTNAAGTDELLLTVLRKRHARIVVTVNFAVAGGGSATVQVTNHDTGDVLATASVSGSGLTDLTVAMPADYGQVVRLAVRAGSITGGATSVGVSVVGVNQTDPQPVPAAVPGPPLSPILAYRADDLLDSPVVAWPSHGGAGPNVPINGAAGYPVAYGVNGQAAVQTGSGGSGFDLMPIPGPLTLNGVTVFVVFTPAVWPNSAGLLVLNSGAAGAVWLTGSNSPAGVEALYIANGTSGQQDEVFDTPLAAGQPCVFEFRHGTGASGVVHVVRTDGVDRAVATGGSYANDPGTGTATIDSEISLAGQGDYYEVLVYDHLLSDADLATVRSYLTARYGLTA